MTSDNLPPPPCHWPTSTNAMTRPWRRPPSPLSRSSYGDAPFIPIGQLNKLAILKLSKNSFSGAIPPELGDCKSLIWLDLNSNRLNGTIPGSLAKQSGKIVAGLVTGKRYVYLLNDRSKECRGAGNLLEFAGVRPEQLGRLPSWRSCNFTRVYTGRTQYTFNNNGSMIFLDLSYNELEGQIPKELGSMYYLMILNLGHNIRMPIDPCSSSASNKTIEKNNSRPRNLKNNGTYYMQENAIGSLRFLEIEKLKEGIQDEARQRTIH